MWGGVSARCAASWLFGVFFVGCAASGPPALGGACTSDVACSPGARCIAGRCESATGRDRPAGDGSMAIEPDGSGINLDDYPTCASDGTCTTDAHCVMNHCVPFSEGEYDETCTKEPSHGAVLPQVQCEWLAPSATDAAPAFRNVLHTPVVADFGIGRGPDDDSRPSLVFVSDATYTEGAPRGCFAAGTLRVVDGATCREQLAATALEDRVNSSVTPAIGDLDGDGTPEIVAAGANGGILAFRYDAIAGALVRVFRGTLADGSIDTFRGSECNWSAISLYDLDDDARPEILMDGVVWSSTGARLAIAPIWDRHGTGMVVPAGDLDDDGRVELLGSGVMYEWVPGTGLVQEAFATPRRGHVAYADFGDFPAVSGDAPGRPEIVIVGAGVVSLHTLNGTTIASLSGTPSGDALIGGGPPTIADFDGDGVAEVGVAFGQAYQVFDFVESRILWSKSSQDLSSATTGSSVFDFNGDARAEVVYADECFLRVYDGGSGEVLFSQARRSATWQENPIVADVDGDASAEIVVGSSSDCESSGYCPAVDPIFAGLRCESAADCPSGSCVEGLCRCTADTECGSSYGCSAPLPGTPGEGNVCRAYHRDCKAGVQVFRDARDRWAASRRIWNQHAYHVTNVDEDGIIPRTSEVEPSWAAGGTNSFRQNVQGDLLRVPGADLVARRLVASCEGEGTRLTAEICNRGAVVNDAGVLVEFRQGGEVLCSNFTQEPLSRGHCEMLECVAPVRAQGVFDAVVDPATAIGECQEGNNVSSGEASCLL